jgi:8-oxo-dGTP pyrophosphatase MutT (NUDIX family)
MTREETWQIIEAIVPFDEKEALQRQDALDWAASDAPLYRIQKPDIPPKHLVSYFVIYDSASHKILLQDHLLAKLWLPAGGHVDPDEDPAETVRRECVEELGITAVFLDIPTPKFITVTKTNGQDEHIDVSLWYILRANALDPLTIEPDKFAEVRWWGIDEILNTPIEKFDPGFHRFIFKMKQAGVLA